MVNLAPAFLKQGPALNLHVIPLILDDIMEGTVNAVRPDFNQVLIVYPGIPVTPVDLGPLCNIIMPGIPVKILDPVPYIKPGVILKHTGNIVMEMDPVLTVQEKNADADKVCHIFMVIGPVDILKPFKMLHPLPDDFFQKMPRVLCSVAVGMDSGPLDIIQIIINKILADIAQLPFNCLVILINGSQFLPRHVRCLKIFLFYIIAF